MESLLSQNCPTKAEKDFVKKKPERLLVFLRMEAYILCPNVLRHHEEPWASLGALAVQEM